MTIPASMAENLKRLHLRRIAALADEKIDEAVRDNLSHTDFLDGLVQEEVNARNEAQFAKRLKGARLPESKTLDGFDFDFQTSVSREDIQKLAKLDFLRDKHNVVLVGPPGVGKTHLAIAIGVKALAEGNKVLFTTADGLIDHLFTGLADETFKTKLKTYASYDLVIVDELGYLEMNLTSSNHFFQFVSQAYQSRSLIVTSNRGFQDWGEVFANQAIAAATLDRLLHNATVLSLKGQSYRLRAHNSAKQLPDEDLEQAIDNLLDKKPRDKRPTTP